MACVDVRALPLQLLLRREPSWRDLPAAVVDRDRPQGVVLWLNEHAFAQGIRTGMRYATGLALAGELRAGEVDGAAVEAGTAEIVGILQRFSPSVEPARGRMGVFWMDATGVSPLYPSLRHWAGALHEALAAASLQARVTVGYTRFSTYALCKGYPVTWKGAPRIHSEARRGGSGGAWEERSAEGASTAPAPPERPDVVVLASRGEERRATRQVDLERLAIEPRLRDTLVKLGIRTVGAFLDLPAEGVRERFGMEAYTLHRWAARDEWAPLQGAPAGEPLSERLVLEDPERSGTGLVFLVKRLLHPLLQKLAARQEGVTEIRLVMGLDRGGTAREALRPAAPTLDVTQLLHLVSLRLEGVTLPSGVVDLTVEADAARVSAEQLRLFAQATRRDLPAAERAFARLRAELGNDAVVHARSREGHLPEATFSWEPLERAVAPRPRAVAERPLVRRIYDRPVPLPPRSKSEPDGWLLRGIEHGSVERFVGPYVVSGGWWATPVHREYHFALMRSGDVYWIYFDKKRRRWYLQGQVE